MNCYRRIYSTLLRKQLSPGAHYNALKVVSGIQQIAIRTASSSSPQPSQFPSSHSTPLWNVTQIQGDQRRTIVTVADLDRTQDGRERVVILGSGWAGYPLARELDHKKFQVVIVSPRSYFVFTPLLASTSVGTLEFRTALEPIRNRRNKARYIQGWADDVDLFNKTITIEEAVADPNTSLAPTGCRNEGKDEVQMEYEKVSKSRRGQMFDLHYDKLIIGVGAYSQTFRTPGVREHAHFLKDVGDARKIRKRLLECFETAALPTTPDSIRKQILHFAIVGGGPTGVEFSAELYDLIHEDLVKIYPELLPHAKISLYDVSPKVLTMFDDKLAKYAMDTFARGGIDIRTSKQISSLSPGLPYTGGHAAGRVGLTLNVKGEDPQGVGMCIWSTGLMANPFIAKALSTIRRFPPKEVIFKDHYPQAEEAQWNIARDEKTGRIVTNDRLRVVIDAPLPKDVEPLVTSVDPTKMSARLRDVFALGDCAFIQHTSYPATAQVANQKAAWLAKRLNAGDMDRLGVDKFTYKSLGIMAYLGNAKAIVGGLGGLKRKSADGDRELNLSGRMAWLVWRGAYLARSISWRNRVLIPVYWCLNWAFGRDISRF
ncbi:hypothetical protein NA57DRAFT_59230 [Rhizodiscina lignyota]|uniref:FAD/NAD(P)-binding domain-containing protein n=1 Tax=Rhizodiscina lignyota TaxID=1504668 RepID=A0A9P4IB69_9PEZI|nr:hypothetical protein NA57DRAFT_59230 [Rhizodiscina lignyota]